MRALCRRAVFMLLLLAGPGVAAAIDVENIRLWSEGANTRVVLDLSGRADFNLFPLRNPDRLVIDIAGGRLDPDLESLPEGRGVVAGIRAARKGENDLRIVLDLNNVARPRTSFAGPLKAVNERLVIDLVDPGVPRAKRTARVADLPARDVVIAIDPGHGGRDPGALGRNKTREKDVVLAIAKRLARRIDAEPGMRAYLTRDDDRLVRHRDRLERARERNADLFISVHADAFTDPRAHGSSVYALSLNGASTEAARWLAESQNNALIGGVTLDDKDDVLKTLLLDLSQNAAISASLKAGNYVLKELASVGRVHKRKVQQANFAVLKAPDVPSILVETAFISNPDEERRLRDAAHQEKLAAAVFSGVRNYFRSNPPPDTLFARRDTRPIEPAAPIRHVIVRGDTLSEIAERYNVRVSTLRQVNQLRDDRVRIGQVLTIPIGS